MKILLTSVPFYPLIGGLNAIAYLAAKDWLRRGHEVRLLTRTPGRFDAEDEMEIIRAPTFGRMLEHYRWCDVVFQNHLSIHFWFPLLVVRRPYVISMSSWAHPRAGNGTCNSTLRSRLNYLLQGFILRRATRNIAACAAVAAGNRVPARVIPNPFDASQFRRMNPPDAERSASFLFAGRLIADKGVDDLLRALVLLRKRGISAAAVIVGDGPEQPRLEAMALELGLSDSVCFVGPKSAAELTDLMNRHRVLVVPSKWYEPIAIVALEAMACGCVVVGSEGGGLAVTIGRCGLTYPNGDYEALASRLAEILAKGDDLTEFTDGIPIHLARYTPDRIGGEYLEEIEKAVRLIPSKPSK